jgi:hypothetical protein
MKYRIIVPKDAGDYPYMIQIKRKWYSRWLMDDPGYDLSGYETIDDAKKRILRHMHCCKEAIKLKNLQPKAGVVMVYTSEDQLADILKGLNKVA